MAEYVSQAGAEQLGGAPAEGFDQGPNEGPGIPAQPSVPDGERKFQELQASGQYSDAQLQSMKADARKQMLQGGKYTPAQIDTYFGDTAPDTSAQHAAVAGNMAKNNQGQLSWWDAFHAGWDTSASAAAMDLATGTKFNNATPQHQGVVNDVLTATGALTGDLPFIGAGMLGGAWAGGTAGTVGGAAAGGGPEDVPAEAGGAILGAGAGMMFAGGAAPQAMRETTLNIQRDHTNYTALDVARDVALSTWQIGKAGALNVLGGRVAGVVGGKALDLGASQIVAGGAAAISAGAVTTTASAALDGRIPTTHDYEVGMITMLGSTAAFHVLTNGRQVPTEAGRRVEANLRNLYGQFGIDPKDLTAAAADNPVLKGEILGQDVDGEPSTPVIRRLAPPEPVPFKGPPPVEGTPEYTTRISHFMGLMTAVEGSGDQAVSPMGAIGKHQIMPGTARQYGYTPEQMFDPATNERAATDIAKDLYKRFNGDEEAMLAAYNAGPKRGAELQAAGRGTRLEAERDPTAKKTGGWRYEKVDAARDESFLPWETQKYLAIARFRAKGPLPGSEWTGGPGEPPSADRGLAAMERPPEAAEGEGGPPAPPEPPTPPAERGEEAEGGEPRTTPITEDEAMDNVGKSIGDEATQPNSWLRPEKMMEQFVSEMTPLRRFQTTVLGMIGGDFDPMRNLNLIDMWRETYASANRARDFVRNGIVDAITLSVNNPERAVNHAATQAIKDGGNLQEWERYMVAVRAHQLHERGIVTGVDPDSAEKISNSYNFKTKYDRATQMLQDTLDGALKYARDSGVYNDKRLAAMKKLNPMYIAFRRLTGDKNYQGGVQGRSVNDPLYRIEGDDGQISAPMLATIDNIYQLIKISDRNRAIGAIIAAGKATGLLEKVGEEGGKGAPSNALRLTDGAVSQALEPYHQYWQNAEGPGLSDEEIRSATDPLLMEQKRAGLGDGQFHFWNNGKLEVWAAKDPDLAAFLRGVETKGQADIVSKSLGSVASLARAGLTLAPAFAAKMTLRHQIQAFQTDPSRPIPALTWMDGMMGAIGMTKGFKDFATQGGLMSSIHSMDLNYEAQDVDYIFRKTGTINALWNTVHHPIELAHVIGERLNAGARYGMYKHLMGESVQAHIGRALGIDNPVEAIKAAMRSREMMIDFSEHGSLALANFMAKITAFQRPHLLGMAALGRALKERPAATLGMMMLSTTLPTVLGQMLCMAQDPFLPPDQRWKNREDWQKDLFYPMPSVGGVRPMMPYVPGVGYLFGALPRRLIEWQYEKDPHAWDDIFASTMHAFMPPMVPNAVEPIAQALTNTNFYSGKAFISGSQQKLSGPMQYYPDTTLTARMIGNALGTGLPSIFSPKMMHSPIQVEALVRGYTGNVGYGVLKALDVPFKQGAGPPWDFADLPFVGSFIARNPGMSAKPIHDFFTDMDTYDQQHNDANTLLKRAGPNATQAMLQGIALQMSEKGLYGPAASMNKQQTKLGQNMNDAANPQQILPKVWEAMRAQRLNERRSAIMMQQQMLQDFNDNPKMTNMEKLKYTDRVVSDMITTAEDANRILHEPAVKVASEF